jgi:hypothetical protein
LSHDGADAQTIGSVDGECRGLPLVDDKTTPVCPDKAGLVVPISGDFLPVHLGRA